MERASVDILHNEEHLLMGFEGFVKLSDIRMVKSFHNFHFSLDTLASVWFKQFNFFINFDGNLLVQRFMKAQADDSVSTLTNTFTDYVVIKVF
jgi:hypothetical protein